METDKEISIYLYEIQKSGIRHKVIAKDEEDAIRLANERYNEHLTKKIVKLI